MPDFKDLSIMTRNLVTAADQLTGAISDWRKTGKPNYRLIMESHEAIDKAVIAIAYAEFDSLIEQENKGSN